MKCHFHLSTPCRNAAAETKGVQMKRSPGAPARSPGPTPHLLPRSLSRPWVWATNTNSLIGSRGDLVLLVQFPCHPRQATGLRILKPAGYQVSPGDLRLCLQAGAQTDTGTASTQPVKLRNQTAAPAKNDPDLELII